MSKTGFSRRDMLRMGAVSTAALAYSLKSPRQLLGESILNGVMNSARAEAGRFQTSRYFVNICLPGGPTRYNFDHWLRTTGEAEVLPTRSLGTGFKYDANGTATDTEYKTFSLNGYEVPYNFMALDATSRVEFLNSFLVIRGFGSGFDGHPLNSPLALMPVGGMQSITGMMADNSGAPYQAVQYPIRRGDQGTSDYRYFSNREIGLNILSHGSINAGGALASLLAPVVSASSARTLRTTNQDLFSQLRAALSAVTDGTPQETKAILIAKNSLGSASALMQRNFAGFEAEYASLYAEYETALTAGIKSLSIPGVTRTYDNSRTINIISDGLEGNANGPFSQYATWRTGSTRNVRPNGTNFLSLINLATLNRFSEGLAVADYCIRNDLSTAIEIIAGNLMMQISGGMEANSHDSHGAGSMANTFSTSVMYNGMLSALMKFKSRMQAAGRWNNTVMHITSDFGRTMAANGWQNDHGFNQMNASVFSGVISGGPYMVGNVYRNVGGSSQGFAAPIAGYIHNGMPGPVTMASTVTELLDVEVNPWKNNTPPLIKLNADGTLILPFGKGKQV